MLGSILFLIYINHVVSGFQCHYKIFADDIKLYLAFPASLCPSADCQFQRCITKLVSTGQSWGLNMNPSKCVAIRFSPRGCTAPYTGDSPYSINGSPIKFVESHTDLGVIIDRSLKFHIHVRKVVAAMDGLTTNFLSSTLCRDSSFFVNIYRSHLRSLMEYASSLWNVHNSGDLKFLE